jgi:flagellum-specific peptidoglycan hydrolase FlgJ
MATPEQIEVLKSFRDAAKVAKHIFPEMAACEACVETNWGESELYRKYRNVFGQKQSHPPIYSTIVMPTQEFLRGKWISTHAEFVVFPTAVEAFEARMSLLLRLQSTVPAYNAALHAATPEEFIVDVSRAWATAPSRVSNCMMIFRSHRDVLSPDQLETV